MTYKNFLKAIDKKYMIEELDESPLLRNDNSYFTFSPFQDTQENFNNLRKSNSLYVKYQRTIRKLDLLNLTNPLNLNYQVTYAIQRYKREYQLPLIESLIDIVKNAFFPQIKDRQVEITYPDVLKGYFDKTKKAYKLKKVPTSERYFSKLGLSGNHYYIKVRMLFKGGSINVVDFVLVDYRTKDFSSQLDSIWVENLIDLLHEDVKFIFDEKKYVRRKKVVERYSDKPRDLHIVINDLETVFKILNLGIIPGAKGISDEVRRKIRKLFFYFYYYIDKENSNLILLVETYGEIIDAKKEIIRIFEEELRKISKNYKQAIKQLQKNSIGRKNAQSSLGIPDEYYGDYLKNWHSEYDF